jgi:hypothetical protein
MHYPRTSRIIIGIGVRRVYAGYATAYIQKNKYKL